MISVQVMQNTSAETYQIKIHIIQEKDLFVSDSFWTYCNGRC